MPDTNSDSNEVAITRVFDVPRELVWRAWTEPEHFKKWWGPKDCISPACEIALRIGGKYLFCMKMKNGQEIWSTGTYKKIVPYEKLVFSHSFADENGNIVPAAYYGFKGNFQLEMEICITFLDIDGKTKMVLKQTGMPDTHIDPMNKGWNESFDKLEKSLN